MFGTIQVDLDALWTYQRYLPCQRFAADNANDPVFAEGLERFLGMFSRCGIKATFFVVGKDAAIPARQRILRRIIAQGHEIANHSMTHPLHFRSLSVKEQEREIRQAHAQLQGLTGKGPVGFRAPMFSINARVMRILREMGYLYDASVIPSAYMPAIINLLHSLLQKKPVRMQGGGVCFGRAPLGVYTPDELDPASAGKAALYEVGISVLPRWRLPMHSTYVFIFGMPLFDYGLRSLEKRNIMLSYLFHGIDLVDLKKHKVKIPFFGSLAERERRCEMMLKKMCQTYELLTTQMLVEKIKEGT
ncbi:MAG: polysaccharide deacetylase family protein [Candidatus Omnitrophica bacterium]|nr:polysaccharide deacetylase family protein [Candidatus Omnitrophota bacterium]MBU4478255.1 polysaccharide deacetylase family protein [Candidatus Omnitrophota bacterium]MCG2703323.1 polysaccharide deacetylase family protein [Candidatus Omnitrophota bacterium]